MTEPTEPSDPEAINPAALAEMQRRAAEGPVVMLNLLAFKPDGGAERYAEYGAAVAPLLERAGARILFAGDGSTSLIGGSGWDLVALVEYPARGAFLEMVGSEEYRAIAGLRTAGLERSELHPLDAADLADLPGA